MLANKHTDKLDCANVSALARQVKTGVMSWLEAQSILDDMIERDDIPVFASVPPTPEPIRAKAIGGPVQFAAKVTDPLDELFA